MKIKIALALILIAATLNSGCGLFENNLTGPSRIDGVTSLASWKPCVVVQNPGFRGTQTFEVQMEAVRKLKSANRIQWMRLGGADLMGNAVDYAVEAKRLGLNVIGIIKLDDLENNLQGWENTYDRIKAIFGTNVDIWQIGGEISNADPSVNFVTMTPEEYIPKLSKLYNYVKRRYPGDVITSAPTFGAFPGGRELETFIKLGLLDIETDLARRHNFIIALHAYTSNNLEDYGKVFNRYSQQLSQKRVWVTETGVNDSSKHIHWVSNFYPAIINAVHPEMICWYVLWAGDASGGHNQHGLITNVENGLPLEERDLFSRLIGGRQ